MLLERSDEVILASNKGKDVLNTRAVEGKEGKALLRGLYSCTATC